MKGLISRLPGRCTSARAGWALILFTGVAAQGPPLQDPQANEDQKVLLYPLQGIVDGARVEKLRTDIDSWLAREPEIRSIILDIESPGTENGDLEPARAAAKYLRDLRGVRVVARLGPDAMAGNASALLVLAARDVVMAPGARLGFIPDAKAGARVEVPDSQKETAAAAREAFEEFALGKRVPVGRTHLAQAMVSRYHQTIYLVRFEHGVANEKEIEVRFMTREEEANLGPVERQTTKAQGEVVVVGGDKLTLTQETAREYGFALPVETGVNEEVLLRLSIHVGPENIIDHKRGGVLKPLPPSGQDLVDFLNHPVVRFVLILGGILGLLLEFKLPGTLIPSITGLVCFAVFFISGLFQTSGAGAPNTSIYEILLFVIGLGLIAVELLLLPGVMVFGLSGAAACLLGLVLAMVPPADSSPGGMTFQSALSVLIAGAGTSVLFFLALVRFLPHSSFMDKSGIVIHSAIQGTPTADSAVEAQLKIAALLGKVGVAVTPLRPSGTVEVDGERLDVVAEGDFVERGEKVRVVEADGTRTVVRPVS